MRQNQNVKAGNEWLRNNEVINSNICFSLWLNTQEGIQKRSLSKKTWYALCVIYIEFSTYIVLSIIFTHIKYATTPP